ncbi:MAG TPA: hypothetical protein VL360_07485 [Gammaproteobacteria bacterium]|jgi:hypothetical protein|nr:hypothetical protein [Gammaproteobacteria bacterium]
MNHSIWQTIASTSWTVVLVFYLLIYFGYRSSKPKTILLQQLHILLIITLMISAVSFYSLILLNSVTLVSWMIMFILGAGFGWQYYLRLNIKPDTNTKGAILVPGSWITMAVVLIVIAARYYFKYEITPDTAMLKTPTHSFMLAVFYGLISGSVFGRTMYAGRVLKQTSPAH